MVQPLPDPEAAVVAYLRAQGSMTALLGNEATRIGVERGAPYPMLRVAQTPGGDDRDLKWLTAPELVVEAWGALPPTAPDREGLRVILATALGLLADLPNQAFGAGAAVVTSVRSSVGMTWLPDPETRQPRYLSVVTVHLHPPRP